MYRLYLQFHPPLIHYPLFQYISCIGYTYGLECGRKMAIRFQYISCIGYTDYNLYSQGGANRFQYISCIGYTLDYDLYYLLDGVQYGDYSLSIFNEGDKVTILIEDAEGSASWVMDKKEFLNISTTEELEKYINNILYYNYNEHKGE